MPCLFPWQMSLSPLPFIPRSGRRAAESRLAPFFPPPDSFLPLVCLSVCGPDSCLTSLIRYRGGLLLLRIRPRPLLSDPEGTPHIL